MSYFFYGWYFKCQTKSHTLVVIPAIHQTKHKQKCSIQIIMNNSVEMVSFPNAMFTKQGRNISIGNNRFGAKGFRLDIHNPGVTIRGKIKFGKISPLKYDIMGPFALVPFMECRHSVYSMRHSICGSINVNGIKYTFNKGVGYWEGDRGRSFPKRYIWTQCCFAGGSLMLSVAEIPVAGIRFMGVIGVIFWKGKQYRIATYLGAKVLRSNDKMVQVIQGNKNFEAWMLEENSRPLRAPTNGDMIRTIHESASCKAFYRFRIKGQLIFEFETNKAAFEYEY